MLTLTKLISVSRSYCYLRFIKMDIMYILLIYFYSPLNEKQKIFKILFSNHIWCISMVHVLLATVTKYLWVTLTHCLLFRDFSVHLFIGQLQKFSETVILSKRITNIQFGAHSSNFCSNCSNLSYLSITKVYWPRQGGYIFSIAF